MTLKWHITARMSEWTVAPTQQVIQNGPTYRNSVQLELVFFFSFLHSNFNKEMWVMPSQRTVRWSLDQFLCPLPVWIQTAWIVLWQSCLVWQWCAQFLPASNFTLWHNISDKVAFLRTDLGCKNLTRGGLCHPRLFRLCSQPSFHHLQIIKLFIIKLWTNHLNP